MVALPDYPLRKTEDCRSAVVTALAEFLEALTFDSPAVTSSAAFRFVSVHRRWADFESKAGRGSLPVAAVLPDRPSYDDATLTPKMLEGTWTGGPMIEGTLGRGIINGAALFKVAELVVPVVLVVRAASEGQRRAIVSVLEDAFVQDGAMLDQATIHQAHRIPETPVPERVGMVLTMRSYYNRPVRFTMASAELLDSAQSAQENRWLAQFELQAEAPVCVLRRVRAMSPRVEIVEGGVPLTRGR